VWLGYPSHVVLLHGLAIALDKQHRGHLVVEQALADLRQLGQCEVVAQADAVLVAVG
jgi:hypothetical protein